MELYVKLVLKFRPQNSDLQKSVRKKRSTKGDSQKSVRKIRVRIIIIRKTRAIRTRNKFGRAKNFQLHTDIPAFTKQISDISEIKNFKHAKFFQKTFKFSRISAFKQAQNHSKWPVSYPLTNTDSGLPINKKFKQFNNLLVIQIYKE
jgi:hypothetical protein